MLLFSAALVSVSLLVLTGAMFLLPMLVRIAARVTSWEPKESLLFSRPNSLIVILPAHNNAEALEASLESLQKCDRSRWESLRIVVVLDRCNDNSRAVSESFGADIVETDALRSVGKWSALKVGTATLAGNPGEVALLVDVGSQFDSSFLTCLHDEFQPLSVIGVAPRYLPSSGGLLARIHWGFEALLKSNENALGGPVSVHGAAVAYRSIVLLRALAYLDRQDSWLNDDVAIPLAARSIFPHGLLRYTPSMVVRDSDVSRSNFSRRRRLARGNMEWIAELFFPLAARSPLVAFVASRRVLRTFWASAILTLVIGVGFLGSPAMTVFMVLSFVLLAYMLPALGSGVTEVLLRPRRAGGGWK